MIPNFSACGYVVAFLRACYSNRRRCFRGHPERITQGVYYRAPAGASAFPGPSIFGTLIWVRGEIDGVDIPLGEQAGRGAFYDGTPPPIRPSATICGPRAWFLDGDPGEPAPPVERQVWGLPACCFPTTVPRAPTSAGQIDLHDPGTLYLLSAIEASTYEGDPATALAILTAWLGVPDSLDFYPNTAGPTPGTIIARYPGFSLVFVSGTTNPQQWILQIVGASGAPVNVGSYSTQPIYRNTSRLVHARIQAAGIPDDEPVVLIGHSYGGAVAQVLGADYRLAQPARVVKVLSLGAPKPGDTRLAAIATANGFVRLENAGDPIPAVPPSIYWTAAIASIVTLPVLLRWNAYDSGGEGRQIQADGSTGPADADAGVFTFMLQFALSVIIIAPVPPYATHYASTYAHRLSLGIPIGHDAFPSPASAITAARGYYP